MQLRKPGPAMAERLAKPGVLLLCPRHDTVDRWQRAAVPTRRLKMKRRLPIQWTPNIFDLHVREIEGRCPRSRKRGSAMSSLGIPRPFGAPWPDERRPRRAGLLARGSMSVRAAFSEPNGSNGMWPDDSPLTVAGAAGVLNPIPIFIPVSGEPVAPAAIRVLGPAGQLTIRPSSRRSMQCRRLTTRPNSLTDGPSLSVRSWGSRHPGRSSHRRHRHGAVAPE